MNHLLQQRVAIVEGICVLVDAPDDICCAVVVPTQLPRKHVVGMESTTRYYYSSGHSSTAHNILQTVLFSFFEPTHYPTTKQMSINRYIHLLLRAFLFTFSISLSLSLSLYIYIYIYKHLLELLLRIVFVIEEVNH
jgi:hypothetical protein